MEHRKHWRDPDARRDEQYGCGARVEDELAPGCGHLDDGAGPQPTREVVAGQAARLSKYTGFMYLGELVEFGQTAEMFTRPVTTRASDYITGRFG